MCYYVHFKYLGIQIFAIVLLVFTPAGATPPVPLEPETENSEYILDLVNNRYSPLWRDSWDSGDNRFRLRIGSNNVERWFLEEELKASAGLIDDRLRFRFWHTRKLRHETEELRGDTFEIEARVFGRNYLSLFVTPSATKADNAFGFALQHRLAVDRYVKLFIEFPHTFRNPIEERKDTSERLVTVFDVRPVRIGLVERHEVAAGLTVWLEGEVVPEFTVVEKEQHGGMETRRETAYARSIHMRLERAWKGRDARPGVEVGYRVDRRKGPPPEQEPDGGGGPAPVAVMEFDADFYGISDNDTISGWRSTRRWIQPYAWVPLDERWGLRGAIHIEERELLYEHREGPSWTVDNLYVVPTLGAWYSVDSRGRNTIEFGWATSLRKRELEHRFDSESDNIQEDRLYLSYEYGFNDTSRLRLMESFELDSDDRGDYGIHDHAFIQLIVGF
jgi:hypothetical protein